MEGLRAGERHTHCPRALRKLGRAACFASLRLRPSCADGHQSASFCGFLEGLMGQGARSVHGGLEVAGAVRVRSTPAASSEGAPPWRLPGWAQAQTPLQRPWEPGGGQPRHTDCPSGLPEATPSGSREEGGLGQQGRCGGSRPAGGSMRPGTAPGRAPPHFGECLRSEPQCPGGERSPNTHASRGRWEES